MKKVFALILIPVMLLVLTACDESAKINHPQNDPSEQGITSQIEIAPNMINASQPNPISQPNPTPQPKTESMTIGEEKGSTMQNINITVGDSVFSAKLYDNSAARAFLAQFPLTLNMSDLNSNEKYYYLADDLPSESTEKPATMNTGDLMCWSGNCLVLFYKSFSNTYGGYVRLGYVDDASDLSDVLGSGNVEVMFAVSDK